MPIGFFTSNAAEMHLNCKFTEKPPQCLSSDSLVSDECLEYIWTETGCFEDGDDYPLGENRRPIWKQFSLM